MQGFELTKQHGQHLLVNPLVVRSIVEKAELRPTDTVLEIGPGTGNLTMALLEKVRRVEAIEIDARMVSELKKRASANPEIRERLHVIRDDFTKMPLESIPPFDVCVSNCPYNISSAIVFRLLQIRPPPRRLVLMFQLEFAQGLSAEPGQEQYGRLTVNAKLLAKTKIIIRVSRNSFRPPPKVDSAVIEMIPTGIPEGLDLDEFNGLTKVLFMNKNKTLGAIFKTKSLLNNLVRNVARLAEIDSLHKAPGEPVVSPPVEEVRAKILEVLTEAELMDRRPAKMPVSDILDLLVRLAGIGVRFAD